MSGAIATTVLCIRDQRSGLPAENKGFDRFLPTSKHQNTKLIELKQKAHSWGGKENIMLRSIVVNEGNKSFPPRESEDEPSQGPIDGGGEKTTDTGHFAF